jgi:hypothetical protein
MRRRLLRLLLLRSSDGAYKAFRDASSACWRSLISQPVEYLRWVECYGFRSLNYNYEVDTETQSITLFSICEDLHLKCDAMHYGI